MKSPSIHTVASCLCSNLGPHEPVTELPGAHAELNKCLVREQTTEKTVN